MSGRLLSGLVCTPLAPVISGLSAIFLAPLLALLLGRAVLVEVVEFAAGEHIVVGPLAVCFLKGPLSPSWHDRETGRGGVGAAEAVATTRAPSLSRCATMMASSWSKTWGGGSSISRLSANTSRALRAESPKSRSSTNFDPKISRSCGGIFTIILGPFTAVPSKSSGRKASMLSSAAKAPPWEH